MYVIKALSNMHVGSGDVNYGVIDNLIQRDPVTKLPGINSSGLKGAIREFFEYDEKIVLDIFGSSPKDESNKTQPGKARFFEANLLSIPIRSDKAPYLMATSPEVIKELIEKLQLFQCEGKEGIISKLESLKNESKDGAIVFDEKLNGACVEEISFKATYSSSILDPIIEKLFGERLVLLSHEAFKTLCDDNHLPVLARNNLNDGISANLWYEQVLPRYTRLYFMIMDGGIAAGNKGVFDSKISSEIFQLGANASIGYGFCRFTELSTLK
jgi:CRISPR-associated protein Cmr4